MDHEPVDLATATQRWTEHVSASLERQIRIGTDVRGRMSGGDYGISALPQDLAAATSTLIADTMTSAGLLADVIRAMADQRR